MICFHHKYTDLLSFACKESEKIIEFLIILTTFLNSAFCVKTKKSVRLRILFFIYDLRCGLSYYHSRGSITCFYDIHAVYVQS